MTASVPPAISLHGIDKSFGAIHANKAIDLAVERGTIHGIVGENGAGKSTLMSILYGFYQPDAGEIRIGGEAVEIRSSSNAIDAGIGMVHQHFMLIEPFTVLENVMLGAEGGAALRAGIGKARAELKRLEDEYSLQVDPDAIVGQLSVGQQQRVEILKALYRGADILILDEPTGVLTPPEADHLFRILRQLKEQGKTIVLITHKLREIMAVTDTVSVMRRGEIVGTVATAETSPEQLAEMMVGRRVLLRVEKQPAKPGAPLLQVEDLAFVDETGVTRFSDVSFTIRAGEIVGIAGVAGNGQSELLEVLSGIRKPTRGSVTLEGERLDPERADPSRLRRLGVAHVPEDRHRTGLVTAFEEWENAALGYHDSPAFSRGGFLDIAAMRGDAREKIELYDIRPPDCRLKTANFSGGNQQKIVLAREMERNPSVLLVGQPTRGVDIGAIEFIHRQLVALRHAGKAVLLVSVELDEVQALSDRILVMCGGRLQKVEPGHASEAEIGLLMAGVTREAA